MFIAWLAFPLVLALVCAGWGRLVRLLPGGDTLDGALVLPLGFAAIITLGTLLTTVSALAPAGVPLVAAGALAGLALLVRDGRGGRVAVDPWTAGAAVGVLLAVGAPVILSGEATFAGYIKLDDTSTWLGFVDQVTSHGRALAGVPQSTYRLVLSGNLGGTGYPVGAFLPLGDVRALLGADAAWLFQPYLAACAAGVALVLSALVRPLVASGPLRLAVALPAACSALLYGYAQWGGIKELVAAPLLALLAACVARAVARDVPRRAALAPLAVAAGAFAAVLGVGAAAWLGPALLAVGVTWLVRAGGRAGVGAGVGGVRAALGDLALLAGSVAVLMVPVWLTLSTFLTSAAPLLSGNGADAGTRLGNLVGPLSALQLGGPWPTGDFRYRAPAGATAPLLLAVLAGLVALGVVCARRRRLPAVAAYPALALAGAAAVALGGSVPWLVAKALAIASPALPAAALTGAVLLGRAMSGPGRFVALGARASGGLLVVVVAGGIAVSDGLAYHDVTLAPRPRLAELDRLAPLLAGHGPTFVNEYDPYVDRHFLRVGAPTEPAEYRPFQMPLRDGTLLTQAAYADLDAFPPASLAGFQSLVTRVSPVASRPPSNWSLVWSGRYYELWRRPAGARRVLVHVPFGDSSVTPYCGRSVTGSAPLCAVEPIGVAGCGFIDGLARQAQAAHAALVGYERPDPVVARADETVWPGAWGHDPATRTLTPTTPGRLTAHIRLVSAQRYDVWLGGSFLRGFRVAVDGHELGWVSDAMDNVGQYTRAGRVTLGGGVHTITLDYPGAGLRPGTGQNWTSLTAIALAPLEQPARRLITVDVAHAHALCGIPLDWVDIVAG